MSSADQVERTGLAGEDIGTVFAADRERSEPVRIPRRDQCVVGQQDDAVRALHPRDRIDETILDVPLARTRKQVQENLAVRGRSEDRTAALEFAANRVGVDEVAVVGNGDESAIGGGAKRLGVAKLAAAGRRIANVTDRRAPRQFAQGLLVEDVCDQAHRAVHAVLTAVRGDDPRAPPAAVLTGVAAQGGAVGRR